MSTGDEAYPAQTARAEGFFGLFHALVKGGWLGVLSHRQLRVLIALLHFVDADGVAWPSAPTIATLTGMQLRHVKRTLAELEHLKIVRVDADLQRGGRWPGGSYKSLIRTISIPLTVAKTATPKPSVTVAKTATDKPSEFTRVTVATARTSSGHGAHLTVADSGANSGHGAHSNSGQNGHPNGVLERSIGTDHLNDSKQRLSADADLPAVFLKEKKQRESNKTALQEIGITGKNVDTLSRIHDLFPIHLVQLVERAKSKADSIPAWIIANLRDGVELPLKLKPEQVCKFVNAGIVAQVSRWKSNGHRIGYNATGLFINKPIEGQPSPQPDIPEFELWASAITLCPGALAAFTKEARR